MKWLISLLMMLVNNTFCSGQLISSDRFLLYVQEIFDSDTCCWRMLAAGEKYLEASMLIKGYLQKSKNISNRHSLHWHLGQMLAKAGNIKEAKHYFKRTYNIFYRWFCGPDGRAWYYYAKGTVAFLDRDKNELIRFLNKWHQENRMDKNYLMLQSLLEGWEQPYVDVTIEK